jgi:hypothetical protein
MSYGRRKFAEFQAENATRISELATVGVSSCNSIREMGSHWAFNFRFIFNAVNSSAL